MNLLKKTYFATVIFIASLLPSIGYCNDLPIQHTPGPDCIGTPESLVLLKRFQDKPAWQEFSLIQELTQAKTNCPEISSIPFAMLGMNQIGQHKYREAQRYLSQALKIHQRFLLTLQNQSQHATEEVIAYTIGLCRLSPTNDPIISPLLRGQFKPGQKEEFLRLFSTNVEYAIGEAAFSQRHFAEALLHYQQALSHYKRVKQEGWSFVETSLWYSLVRIGESYAWLNQPNKALPFYQEAFQLADRLTLQDFNSLAFKLRTFNEYAWTLYRAHQPEQAAAITTRGKALQTDLMKQYQDTEQEAYLRSLPSFPGEYDKVVTLLKAAQVPFETGQWKDVEKASLELIEQLKLSGAHPSFFDFMAHFMLGQAYLEQGQEQRGNETLQQAVQLLSNEEEDRLLYIITMDAQGLLWHRREHEELAIRNYQQALETLKKLKPKSLAPSEIAFLNNWLDLPPKTPVKTSFRIFRKKLFLQLGKSYYFIQHRQTAQQELASDLSSRIIFLH